MNGVLFDCLEWIQLNFFLELSTIPYHITEIHGIEYLIWRVLILDCLDPSIGDLSIILLIALIFFVWGKNIILSNLDDNITTPSPPPPPPLTKITKVHTQNMNIIWSNLATIWPRASPHSVSSFNPLSIAISKSMV